MANLQSGAIEEKFQFVLRKVLANISDPNRELKATREINIKIKMMPSESGDKVAYSAEVTCKLPPIKSGKGVLHLGKQKGENQLNLFEEVSVELPLFEKKTNEIIMEDAK